MRFEKEVRFTQVRANQASEATRYFPAPKLLDMVLI